MVTTFPFSLEGKSLPPSDLIPTEVKESVSMVTCTALLPAFRAMTVLYGDIAVHWTIHLSMSLGMYFGPGRNKTGLHVINSSQHSYFPNSYI
jgi:hypothetical protein